MDNRTYKYTVVSGNFEVNKVFVSWTTKTSVEENSS